MLSFSFSFLKVSIIISIKQIFRKQQQRTMQSPISLSQIKTQQRIPVGKTVSPHQMLTLLKKNENNRVWILKQLEQLGIDISLLEGYPLCQLYRNCDQIIRSTYSVKYLGLNNNQMGIISRRIDPFKDGGFSFKYVGNTTYTVNKFFFPKPLKVGRKPKKQNSLGIENLEEQIKKAFDKNNPNLHKKQKVKTQLSGSWMNYQLQNSSIRELRSANGRPLSTLSTNTQATRTESTKKLKTSYSRFLASGFAFNDS